MKIDAKKILLTQLTEIRAGYPFRGSVPEVSQGPVCVVQMRDIDLSGAIDWSNTVRTALPERKTPDWLKNGDVLFASRGTRFYAACVADVPGQAVCGPHFFHLRLRKSVSLLPQFLAWQINQPPIQRLLMQAAEGSSQLSIRRGVLEGLPIALPALSDQEKIVQLAQLAAREKVMLTALMHNRDKQLEALALELAKHPID